MFWRLERAQTWLVEKLTGAITTLCAHGGIATASARCMQCITQLDSILRIGAQWRR